MIVALDVATSAAIPDESCFERWALATLGTSEAAEVSIRVVDESESARLNETYRKKAGATNVLSFPCELPPGIPCEVLGDLVICAPLVEQEAHAQGKAVKAHWAHLVVHGLLHLRGFDHVVEDEAVIMETLEAEIMARLGYPNPYLDEDVVE